MAHTVKDFQHQLSFLLLSRSVGLRQLFGFVVCFDQSQQEDYIPEIKETSFVVVTGFWKVSNAVFERTLMAWVLYEYQLPTLTSVTNDCFDSISFLNLIKKQKRRHDQSIWH